MPWLGQRGNKEFSLDVLVGVSRKTVELKFPAVSGYDCLQPGREEVKMETLPECEGRASSSAARLLTVTSASQFCWCNNDLFKLQNCWGRFMSNPSGL